MTAFHYHGGYQIESLNDQSKPQKAACEWLLVDNDLRPELDQVVRLNEWRRIQTVRRPSDNNEDVTLYRRRTSP